MTIDPFYCPVVRINAPEIYADPRFQAWLNDPARHQATWHAKGYEPGEGSDCFFTWDHDEGSDAWDLPEPVWAQLCQILGKAGVPLRWHHVLIWLTNFTE